jgi:hypothetical protein
MKNSAFTKAIDDITEVFRFDFWMRFYYIFEENNKLYLRVPEEILKEIDEKNPAMTGLVEMLNNDEIDQQKSTNSVCSYVGARFDGTKFSSKIVPRVFDSKQFKVNMYLFNLWIKGHESYLESEIMSFDEWKELYEGWVSQKEVQDYIAKLQDSKEIEMLTVPGTQTIQ